MSKLIVKNEGNRFYLKSGQSWTVLPERLRTLADVKTYYGRPDIELLTSAGLTYKTIHIQDYDKLHLSLKDEDTESQIYFPEASEKQIIDFLLKQGKDAGFDQVVIRFDKPLNLKPGD